MLNPFLGGLYYAISEEEPIMEEDMQLITLIPKLDSFQKDFREILNFIKEDCNALGPSKFPFFVFWKGKLKFFLH